MLGLGQCVFGCVCGRPEREAVILLGVLALRGNHSQQHETPVYLLRSSSPSLVISSLNLAGQM